MSLIYAWGSGSHGQLLGKQVEELDKPEIVCALIDTTRDSVLNMASGGAHTLLLTNQGKLLVCGQNDRGQLGLEKCERALKLLENQNCKSAAAGWNHTLLLTDTGTINAFGASNLGQLGSELFEKISLTIIEMPNRIRICKVACGMWHSAALDENGFAWVWGNNSKNQCGIPELPSIVKRPNRIEFLHNVVDLSLGANHSLLFTKDNCVYSCGLNSNGQCGLKPSDDSCQQHFDNDSNRPYKKKKQIIEKWTKILNANEIVQVECGWNHSLILCRDNEQKTKLLSFGRNCYGQLGINSQTLLHSHELQTVTLCESDSRNNDFERLNCISSGSEHVLALTQSGIVYSWGWNEHGQLGLGHKRNQFTPQIVPDIPKITRIFCGSGCSFAVAANESSAFSLQSERYLML